MAPIGTMSESLLASNSVSEAPEGSRSRVPPVAVSRHRRIHKEVGAVTGISFMSHPQGKGVLVSDLTKEGACAKSGVQVGDHITKINGERVTDPAQAASLCDAAWTAEADGTDKNKDRLKFSLHFRTQGFEIGRQMNGLSAGALVGVEVISSTAKKGLLGGGKKLEDTGLSLGESTSGVGALVTAVTPDSLAHVAGLDPGLTIVAIDGKLILDSKQVAKAIDTARSKNGCASLICHLPKSKDDDAEHI